MRSNDWKGPVRWCVLAAILAAAVASTVHAFGDEVDRRAMMIAAAHDSLPDEVGEKTLSPYFFAWGDGEGTDQLPLKSSSALVDITGVIANVQLEQVYRNDGETTLEAIYLFPASTGAAVHGMKMTVGERVIEARIKKRVDARKIYENARNAGKTASLLEQQRPNVFEMSVANILPGDEVQVELSYTELLVPSEKMYEFVLPTVVGPRYSNTPVGEAGEDERWVANPYLHQGEPPVFDYDVDLHISSPLPIAKAFSPSHHVNVEYEGDTEAHVILGETGDTANRDYVLRYILAREEILAGVLTYEDAGEKFFMMMMEPPKRVEQEQVLPREYLFILDVSGSMNGFPLDVSKKLMRDILLDLEPGEYFNVLTFAGGSEVYSEQSVEATSDEVSRALRWIDGHHGGGGTQLIPALERAVGLQRREGTSRIVVVATDGYVSVERKAYEIVARELSEANVFTFGIGTSVNRELIEGMARAGQGEPFVVLDEKEALEKAARFRKYVSSPLLTDIDVRFEGFNARSVEPAQVPDLFADRPIVLTGKYRGKAGGTIVVSGETDEGPWSKTMVVGSARPPDDNRALRYLWARKKIARLSDGEAIGKPARKAITALGLQYGLMTAHTSFVAVDTVVRADGSRKKKVRQPLALPAGVSDSAVGDPQNAMGALMGSQEGSNYGYGGLGIRGTGRGGGGVGYGSIGLGNITTIGHGAGGGTGAGYGRGSGSLGGRTGKAVPKIRVGKAQVKGSLATDVIGRVIRRNIGQIKHVYEKGLKSNPKLKGRVVVKFVIAASGKVISASISTSTLNDKAVENGILNVIKRMTFPSTSGGVVVVSYPFVFKSAK